MLLLKQTAVVLLFVVALTHAGVVRNVDDGSLAPKTEEATIVLNIADNEEAKTAEPALSKDEDAGVKTAPASLDPAPGTAFDDIEVTVNDKKQTTETSTTKVLDDNETSAVALSRDEGATIHIDGVTLEPSSSETLENVDLLIVTDDIALDDADEEKTKKDVKPLEKSSKLLLLSTPKLSEKAKIDEENIEEPVESDLKAPNEEEENTTNAAESTEASTLKEEQEKDNKHDNAKDDEDSGVIHFVTQLFKSSKPTAAEETKSATEASNKNLDNDAKDSKDLKPEEKVNDGSASDATTATPLAAVAEEMSQQHNDNIASDVLIETESDYVLVDADAEQFGTFTHVDSAEHLQPIVESIEIVPTHLDEPLIVSYVHHW